MATTGNERYLRHIWLLGEGGLLVLRGIVTRETATSGQPLETILASKRSLFTNILREQYLVIFPTSATVNGDVNTWDISLLLLVIKKIFWSRLSPADKSSIGTIKSYRNDIQGHPACLSMTGNDYATNRALLEAAIRQLSIGLSAQKNSEMQDIIQKTASGEIDIGSVVRRIEDLHEFKTILHSLEDKLDHFNSTLSDINNSFKDVPERLQQIVSDMAKLHKRFVVDQTRSQKTKDLETIVQANCSDKEKQKKAIELLYSVVEIIQSRGPFSEFEIKTMISQRIDWYGEVTLQLIEDVIKWFLEINDNPDTSLGRARLGSIYLPIKCFSMGGLLRHIDYMNGSQSEDRLLEISSKMRQNLGFLLTLSWSVVPESLQDVLQALYKLSEPPKIVLPTQTASVNGLQNIWKMFGGEEKNAHVLNISEKLSSMLGVKIDLTASVDRNQFQKALFKTGMPHGRSEKNLMMTDQKETVIEKSLITSARRDWEDTIPQKYWTKEINTGIVATKHAFTQEETEEEYDDHFDGLNQLLSTIDNYDADNDDSDDDDDVDSDDGYVDNEEKQDVGTGRSQKYEWKDTKSKNQDDKTAYNILDRSEETVLTTDTTETRGSFFSSFEEFLLRPFKSQANKGTETETHGSTPLKLQANEGTETETHEKTKLERRRIWDSMIGRDRLEELAKRSYIKEDIEHKKHTHLLEKTKLKPRRESGSMIGRDRLEDLARKTTKEDIEHKKHTHLLEESKLKLDDVISRSAALKKRQTIKRIDEATWDPFVHPVKEHEKTATKAEVEDKTHTTVANKEI